MIYHTMDRVRCSSALTTRQCAPGLRIARPRTSFRYPAALLFDDAVMTFIFLLTSLLPSPEPDQGYTAATVVLQVL